MFRLLFKLSQKLISGSNPPPSQPAPVNDVHLPHLYCKIGEHEFNNPPPENWKACGILVTTQKRYVTCQRPGCGYHTTQVRERLRFEWRAPYGPWRDALAPTNHVDE